MTDFEFANPEFFWLLLLVPVFLYLKKRYCKYGSVGFSHIAVIKVFAARQRKSGGMILGFLRTAAIVMMIVAMARPRISDVIEDDITSGIDIVLAVDISSSMMAVDLWTKNELKTRLDVAKDVITDFIRKRTRDRIGLVTFAGEPYLVSPLTMNHDWLIQNLDRLNAGIIEDGTAIGSAIAMCANRLRDVNRKSKIVILLTDGCNNSGVVSPKIAAEAASQFGVKIYSVGVGKDGVVPILQVDRAGKVIKNSRGVPFIQHASIPVDMEMLKEIATLTGGECFRATSEQALSDIYNKIDQLETYDIAVKMYSKYDEKFGIFLLIAALLLGLEFVLRNTKLRRVP